MAVQAQVHGMCGTRTQPQVSVSPWAHLVIAWDVFFSLEMSSNESFSIDFIKYWLMVGTLPYDKTEFEKCLPVLNLLHSHGWVLPLVSLIFIESSWCNSCFVVTLLIVKILWGRHRRGAFNRKYSRFSGIMFSKVMIFSYHSGIKIDSLKINIQLREHAFSADRVGEKDLIL